MAYLLEILGRGLLAELSAAFCDRLADDSESDTRALESLTHKRPHSAEVNFRCGVRALRERRTVDAERFFTPYPLPSPPLCGAATMDPTTRRRRT